MQFKNSITLALLALSVSVALPAYADENEAITTEAPAAQSTVESAKQTEMYMVTVPSSGFIQNAIMLASIKGGSGSNTIEAIVNLLKANKQVNLMVWGENQPLVVATIEASIKEMKGQTSATKLYYNGEKKYCDEITQFAKDSGIQVVTTVK